VPGLLQTEEYARAIFRTRLKTTDEEIDELVAARLKRQEILARDDPPMLWIVLDEAVLRRQVGGQHVICEQINRMVQAARQPTMVIEVVPASAGAYLGLLGAFAIADFEDGPSVGYQDGAVRGQPVEEPQDVAALDLIWDTLRGIRCHGRRLWLYWRKRRNHGRQPRDVAQGQLQRQRRR
jgi:Domain of unknown function (DUF5753)